jgi:CheY-like chemotaxis protein
LQAHLESSSRTRWSRRRPSRTTSAIPGRRKGPPGGVVLDIDLTGLDGLTAAEHLHRRQAECRALVLTGLSQPGKPASGAEGPRAWVYCEGRPRRNPGRRPAAGCQESADDRPRAGGGRSTEEIGARLSLSPGHGAQSSCVGPTLLIRARPRVALATVRARLRMARSSVRRDPIDGTLAGVSGRGRGIR